MSAQVQGFSPGRFLAEQTTKIRGSVSGKAIAAVSGGIDSTIAAFLARQALGENLVPILIDTGFMRLDEPESVKAQLSETPIELKVRVVRAAGKFLDAVKGESSAEEKRKKFRTTFYEILGEEAKKEGCDCIVQGTIAPDWIETQGGIKTQHNILEQVGIDSMATFGFKTIEPLSELYKDQVRTLGKHLDVPVGLSQRQPFPGPGLLVRCIGKVTKEKLQALKGATKIVERRLGPAHPDQFFAAVIDNEFSQDSAFHNISEHAANSLGLRAREVDVDVFEDRVTGVKGDERCYGRLAGVRLSEDARETFGWLPEKLQVLQSRLVESFPEITRVALLVKERKTGRAHSVLVRAVSTRDFMTAAVTPIPWKTLKDTATEILENGLGTRVYYDISPKPPATIEFE